MTTVYKSLNSDLTSTVQRWSWKPYLPKGEKPGKWAYLRGVAPALCVVGFHGWLTLERAKTDGDLVYEMELDDHQSVVVDGEKAAGNRARLVRLAWKFGAEPKAKGIRRCRTCGKTHDGYPKSRAGSDLTWSDRTDGHEPDLESWTELVDRTPRTERLALYREVQHAIVRDHPPRSIGSSYRPVVPAFHEFKEWPSQVDRCSWCGVPAAFHVGWEGREALRNELGVDPYELLLVIDDLREQVAS